MPERLATSREVADYLQIHVKSLDRWASQGVGPAYSKMNGVRRYDWADVTAWVKDQRTPAGPSWTCSACKEPVDSAGHLVVSIDHAVLHGEADWGVFHEDCRVAVPNPYEVDLNTVRTWPQLASLVAHLLEKDWAHDTDLTGLLRKAGADA